MQLYNTAHISKTPGSKIQQEILNCIAYVLDVVNSTTKTFHQWVTQSGIQKYDAEWRIGKRLEGIHRGQF
jgi:hypothetical protein